MFMYSTLDCAYKKSMHSNGGLNKRSLKVVTKYNNNKKKKNA